MSEPKLKIRILDFAAFVKLANMMDQGPPGSGRATEAIMDGDLKRFWNELVQSSRYVFSKEGFAELIDTALKYGFIKFVVEATPLKRSFTMFGIEVGF